MKGRALWVVLALLLGAVVLGWRWWGGDPQSRALRAREELAAALGRAIRAAEPGARVIIVSNPFTRLPGLEPDIYAYEAAGIKGLRQGLGKEQIAAVVYPELRSGAFENPREFLSGVETGTPLSYLMKDDALDALARSYPEATVMVTLVGLPVGIADRPVWELKHPAKFAMLLPDLRLLGDSTVISNAFETRKVIAIAVQPDTVGAATQTKKPPAGIIVTQANLQAVQRAYPRSFP